MINKKRMPAEDQREVLHQLVDYYFENNNNYGRQSPLKNRSNFGTSLPALNNRYSMQAIPLKVGRPSKISVKRGSAGSNSILHKDRSTSSLANDGEVQISQGFEM